MADIPFPRGVRDLMPNEALFRNEVLRKLEEVYRRFGYLTIDTPTFESVKVLKAKNAIGEDTKLIYELKYEDLALRYDFTVSLARYVSMHQNLPLPFKRFAIGKAWRREEPQKLRYREFTQADVDIVGGRAGATDAEVIAVSSICLQTLGIEYTVQINNRKLVEAYLAAVGIKPELVMPVMRAVDKLDKIGRDGVIEMLGKAGLSRDQVTKVDALVNLDGTNDEKLSYIEKMVKEKESISELREMLELLKLYELKGPVNIDFSLMRGFDYYTGTVFEHKAADKSVRGSLGGGGRYDNLIGIYSGAKTIPAVGSSLGIDRLLDIMSFSSSPKQTYAEVFIVTVKDKNYRYALQTANLMRSQGVFVDLNMSTRNIANQLSYANSLKFKYAIIIGDSEEGSNKLKMRNLVDGTELTLGLEEVLKVLKEGK